MKERARMRRRLTYRGLSEAIKDARSDFCLAEVWKMIGYCAGKFCGRVGRRFGFGVLSCRLYRQV